MQLGDLEVHVLNDSRFWLDGGQMFGLVPKVFWEKETAPDERNRIPLGVHPLLVRSGSRWALLDAGNGDKFDSRFRDIYRIEEDAPLRARLVPFGLEPRDISLVVLSHLHFDHAGGASRREDDRAPAGHGSSGRGPDAPGRIEPGRIVPAFPNARVVIDRGDWHDAWHPNEYTKGGYKKMDFECLDPVAEWVDPEEEEAEVLPGVFLVRAPGHTAHHRCMRLSSQGRTLFYTVDLLPQTHHVRLPWIAGLDHYPLTSLENKKRVLARAAEEGWWMCFSHQPGPATLARIARRDGAFVLREPLREALPAGEASVP